MVIGVLVWLLVLGVVNGAFMWLVFCVVIGALV